MDTDHAQMHVRVQSLSAATAEPLGDVGIEVVVADDGHAVVARARTGPDGYTVLALDAGLWGL